MSVGGQSRKLAATVNVRQLNTLRWGPMRQLFPGFVEEMELGRYLKQLLAQSRCRAVQVEQHRDASGQASEYVFDVFFIDDAP